MMLIYGGLVGDASSLSNDIFILDIDSMTWTRVSIVSGVVPALRDSHSCAEVRDLFYIFGGQGQDEKLLNDLFLLEIQQLLDESRYIAKWRALQVSGALPLPR